MRERQRINVNGVMLVSTVLNFETISFARGNDLPGRVAYRAAPSAPAYPPPNYPPPNLSNTPPARYGAPPGAYPTVPPGPIAPGPAVTAPPPPSTTYPPPNTPPPPGIS